MTKEKKEVLKATPFETYTDKNGNLKRYLNLALKNTREIMKMLLPKIAVEIQKMIEFHISITKGDIKTDKNKIINEKAIREHIYSMVGYVAKEEKNGAFEIVVARAMHLAIMKVNTPNDIKIDDENSKIYMVSKVATPFLKVEKKGQKGSVEFKPNTDDKLVEINTGTIDTVYKVRTGKISKGSQTKDTKMIANNFKAISKAFYLGLEKFVSQASKKDVKFFDSSDEELWQYLSNSFTIFNSEAYQVARKFSQEYMADLSGNKVIKKETIKNIA